MVIIRFELLTHIRRYSRLPPTCRNNIPLQHSCSACPPGPPQPEPDSNSRRNGAVGRRTREGPAGSLRSIRRPPGPLLWVVAGCGHSPGCCASKIRAHLPSPDGPSRHPRAVGVRHLAAGLHLRARHTSCPLSVRIDDLHAAGAGGHHRRDDARRLVARSCQSPRRRRGDTTRANRRHVNILF